MSNYKVNDLVVIRNYDRIEVGVVTNKRPVKSNNVAGKIAGYDVRTERGSALPVVGVVRKKSNITIDSVLTETWLQNGGTSNLHVHKNVGHTRSNYRADMVLWLEGDDGKPGHYEKANDFIFNVQGARSF